MVYLYVANENTMKITQYNEQEGTKQSNPKLRNIKFKTGKEKIILPYAVEGINVEKLSFLPSKNLSWIVLFEKDDEKAIKLFKEFYKDIFYYFTLTNL